MLTRPVAYVIAKEAESQIGAVGTTEGLREWMENLLHQVASGFGQPDSESSLTSSPESTRLVHMCPQAIQGPIPELIGFLVNHIKEDSATVVGDTRAHLEEIVCRQIAPDTLLFVWRVRLPEAGTIGLPHLLIHIGSEKWILRTHE